MSRSYDDAFAVAGDVRLTTQACPRFVEFVEAGITGGDELLGVAREYLAPLQAADIDTLILGCTHYPLLTGVINYVLGDEVVLVSSSEACAQDTYARLTHKGLLHDAPRHATREFLTTGDADSFQGIGERLLGHFVRDVRQIEL
jgi:glutamate racemase